MCQHLFGVVTNLSRQVVSSAISQTEIVAFVDCFCLLRSRLNDFFRSLEFGMKKIFWTKLAMEVYYQVVTFRDEARRYGLMIGNCLNDQRSSTQVCTLTT